MSTLSDAAETYCTLQPIADAISKDLEAAKKILKEHLRESRTGIYHNIAYSTITYNRLDPDLARSLLGPKKSALATVETRREFLALPVHLRKGAIDLAPLAKAG